MSYDDDKHGDTFPTRHGVATGAANERQMLDSIGGATGARKAFRKNLDGSITMCATRNGSPEFTTSKAPPEVTPVDTITLFYRPMSENFPLGCEVRTYGGTISGEAQNSYNTFPIYDVFKAEVTIGTDVTTVGDRDTHFFDTQGAETWFDTRAAGDRQFDEVLSWPGFSPSVRMANPMNEYYSFVTGTAYSGRYEYDFPPDVHNTVYRGTRQPGDASSNRYPHRFTQTPQDDCILSVDGVPTTISGKILAACKVMVSGVPRYRLLLLPNCNYGSTHPDRNVMTIADYTLDGVLIGTPTTVTLPSPTFVVTGFYLCPRWNSSGSQAAICVQYTNNEYDGGGVLIPRIDLLLVSQSGTSELGPKYGSSTRTTETVVGQYELYEQVWNYLVGFGYVGDVLKVFRRERTVKETKLMDGYLLNDEYGREIASASSELMTQLTTDRIVLHPEGAIVVETQTSKEDWGEREGHITRAQDIYGAWREVHKDGRSNSSTQYANSSFFFVLFADPVIGVVIYQRSDILGGVVTQSYSYLWNEGTDAIEESQTTGTPISKINSIHLHDFVGGTKELARWQEYYIEYGHY